ncbi:MAG: hypothetical protein IKW80_06035 [Thermoguttaceae bacterium]|nr:hypothetical protein [Thermoguttaceae bacterium]
MRTSRTLRENFSGGLRTPARLVRSVTAFHFFALFAAKIFGGVFERRQGGFPLAGEDACGRRGRRPSEE